MTPHFSLTRCKILLEKSRYWKISRFKESCDPQKGALGGVYTLQNSPRVFLFFSVFIIEHINMFQREDDKFWIKWLLIIEHGTVALLSSASGR